MKLPRWLVIVMLASSVLLVLVASGWWWVTWPQRTAREFFELIKAGNMEQAKAMTRRQDSDGLHWANLKRVVDEQKWSPETLLAHPRSVLDLIAARQTFHKSSVSTVFTVQRGTVTVAEKGWQTEGTIVREGWKSQRSGTRVE